MNLGIVQCREKGIDTKTLGLQNMITAGDPGGGDPLIRKTITDAFGCTLRESMGIGDISLSVWAEDAAEDGMNFMARGFVHVELIDPVSGQPIAWEDGAQGELVYTALQRQAMPLVRFRSRDPRRRMSTVLRELTNQTILLGVIDLSTEEVETPELVVERVERALPYIDKERIVLAPDCGMKYLSREASFGKMQAMAAAAKILRDRYGV